MDPLFMAISLFRRRKFEECAKRCSVILEKNQYDQVTKNITISKT
jgi:tetratricopeptide repeat protein 8